ncbi:hypothetical protein PPL_09452 [Heterostelium album PN500]|uniref:Cysteine dioxygenase n=1 Tax=Heterostelium pallidum (strain ATCC 26659 / Pp 5 / PN500) TaxID=670386 RepID=D3BPI3_HETP5|nr:hypothetical protein PPL_09452 [Heterostelium album PN500]EFA76701.1 hypothetical protein PPL_09452 [Heterostelium album PN500]|eukprot:XP_020428833.1 hypothetical protein PPL_09452 [Heterostelium album PN500]
MTITSVKKNSYFRIAADDALFKDCFTKSPLAQNIAQKAGAMVAAVNTTLHGVASGSGATVFPEHYLNQECYVKSQGAIRFKIVNPTGTFRIFFNSKKEDSKGAYSIYVLEVSASAATFLNYNNNNASSILATTLDSRALLETDNTVNYWFSLDKKNKVLKYGKGEATEQLTLLAYKFPPNIAFLQDLAYIGTSLEQSFISKVKFYELPVTFQLPPYVINNDVITLDDIEAGHITAIGNLPKECQQLYSVVAGNSVVLPDAVTIAIRKSLDNKGALYKKCVEKAQEHHSKLEETYLRVTLGMDSGYSPGIPFVLELWPKGHNSPIHQHSDAFAIIKVLHGTIHCNYYSDLNPKIHVPYLETDFSEKQVTYLTPYLYQTHMLKNISQDFCATIQCYRYSSDDRIHYEYFDFLNDQNKIDKFTPNTDYTYAGLKKVLQDEGLLAKKVKKQVSA